MSDISSYSHMIRLQDHAKAASDFRQQGQTRTQQASQAAYSMELAMANRFLELGLAADNDLDNPRAPGGSMGSDFAGFGMAQLQSNVLATLARIAPPATPGPLPASRAPESTPEPEATPTRPTPAAPDLGALSAEFESGPDAAAAIGYDPVGGTSYGTFQISSRQGSFAEFLNFLDQHAPAMADTLRQAGHADTGSRHGAMPEAWRSLADSSPEFADLQKAFIQHSHYLPALQNFLQTSGLSAEDLPLAVREALFSTAVQHGPSGAAAIFNQALQTAQADLIPRLADSPSARADLFSRLLSEVYNERSTRFASSPERVQHAVTNRLHRERDMALAMLGQEGWQV